LGKKRLYGFLERGIVQAGARSCPARTTGQKETENKEIASAYQGGYLLGRCTQPRGYHPKRLIPNSGNARV
jgi:hypothetical protein